MSTKKQRRFAIETPTSGIIARMLEGVKIVPVRVVADELGVDIRRVQQYCEKGRLGSKVNGSFFITRRELDEFKKIPRKTGRPRTST